MASLEFGVWSSGLRVEKFIIHHSSFVIRLPPLPTKKEASRLGSLFFDFGMHRLQAAVAGTCNHFVLMLLAQVDEANGITRHADREVRIVFRMSLCVTEQVHVEHVHIQVVSTLSEVTVHHAGEVGDLHFLILTECGRVNGEGIGDTVTAGIVVELSHRVQGERCAGSVTTVHGVSARSECFASLTAVRRCTSVAAVHHVGGDGEERQGVFGVTVARGLLEFLREVISDFLRDGVHAVIVVTELREVAFDHEVSGDAVFVTNRGDLGVTDCGECVSDHGDTSAAECHPAVCQMGIVQCHLGLRSASALFLAAVSCSLSRIGVNLSKTMFLCQLSKWLQAPVKNVFNCSASSSAISASTSHRKKSKCLCTLLSILPPFPLE